MCLAPASLQWGIVGVSIIIIKRNFNVEKVPCKKRNLFWISVEGVLKPKNTYDKNVNSNIFSCDIQKNFKVH